MADSDKGDHWAHRRGLSFAQAEGKAPLPSQLELGVVSREMKALLWDIFVRHLDKRQPAYGSSIVNSPHWLDLLRKKWVRRENKPSDSFSNIWDVLIDPLKKEIWSDDYVTVLDCVQWFMQNGAPSDFCKEVGQALLTSRSAYRVVDGTLIVPISQPNDAEAFERGIADANRAGIGGAATHLRKAGAAATGGRWADCVREAIHAVEAAARVLDPTASTLDPALKKLEGQIGMHPAFRAGVGKLYAYTNDESGIRHSLLEDGENAVDEVDALFMLGACASFVSYLIGKSRKAGLTR